MLRGRDNGVEILLGELVSIDARKRAGERRKDRIGQNSQREGN